MKASNIKRIGVGLALVTTFGLIAGCALPGGSSSSSSSQAYPGVNPTQNTSDAVYPKKDNGHILSDAELAKMDKIAYYINEAYLYGDEVDSEGLADAIYAAEVAYLNEKYSCYYDEESYKSFLQTSEGKYCGIGASLLQDPDTKVVSIVKCFRNSGALDAGLLTGDRIVGIKDVDISDMDLSEIVTYIKGDAGTEVTLTIERESEGVTETFDVTIERRQIEVDMVSYEMLEDGIGHIEIWQFEDTTYQQFLDALADLESQGMKSLVLDLRDNPGGIVDGAVDVLGVFLDEKLAVYTLDKNGSKLTYNTSAGVKFDGDMVVLINGNTASASEITTGCLQDYGVATIMGQKSYGKGIVQGIYSLGDGTGLKITVSDYYTPNGRNIHKQGIEPDVLVEADPDTKADEQLDAAVEYLKTH